jgi:hypothetical protein
MMSDAAIGTAIVWCQSRATSLSDRVPPQIKASALLNLLSWIW